MAKLEDYAFRYLSQSVVIVESWIVKCEFKPWKLSMKALIPCTQVPKPHWQPVGLKIQGNKQTSERFLLIPLWEQWLFDFGPQQVESGHRIDLGISPKPHYNQLSK